jgi:site-specific recombinase XerD
MANDSQILQMFCRAIGLETPVGEVAPDRVLSFLAGTGPATRYWHRKHQALGGLYRFALARNYVSASPLPVPCPLRPPSRAPYIFTREELLRLLESTDSFPNRKNTLSRYCFRVLLLLLYGAGLRIGEALALTVTDMDLVAGVLTIRNTKFHKTRLVPVGPALQGVLTRYGEKRILPAGHVENSRAPFFLNRQGVAPGCQQVESAFRRLRVHAGIHRSDGLPHPPRIHDLRHAFAVHRLVSWYRQGANVQKLLPQLATYLGHVNISSTQWYLTMTPELLSQASLRFEHYALEVDGDA